MNFNLETRTVTLESCTCCHCNGRKTQPGRKTCPDCKGTRRGKRGGRGTCKTCYNGTVLDWDNLVPCEGCKETPGLMAETIYDSVLPDQFRTLMQHNILPIEFVEVNRGVSFNEAYLGLGCVMSCEDYGRSWDRLHRGEDLDVHNGIREELCESRHQLCKVAKEKDGIITLATKLVCILNRGGYSIRASFTDDASPIVKHAQGELSTGAAIAVGTRIADEGGNGTLIAALISR